MKVPGDERVMIVGTCVEQEIFKEVIETLGFREN